MGVLVSILTTVLGMYLFTIFSEKEKPLSRSGFMTSCIVTLVLFSALTYCFHQLAFENRWDYSLNNKEKEKFQKALISQKANIDKKYGVGHDMSGNKYDSADTIAIENSERFGVYANPLKVEEYFDDDAYYYWDHIYYFHGAIYLGAMYCLYRRRVKQK